MRRLFKDFAVGAAAFGCIVVGLFFLARSQQPSYPYGSSHCCLKGLGLALSQCAQKYDGHYPAGAGSPEASLSLLYREGSVDANCLRGKTVPVEKVQRILEHGNLLGPGSCGWHYVEGLTTSDDGRLAIVWDKVGLGHNGVDLHGGHSVWFLGYSEEVVPAAEWSDFLKHQQELMAARRQSTKQHFSPVTEKRRKP
jgi:hypothetical protein